MRLLDVIGHWLGRMEVVLAGAEDTLRAGEEAIARGDAMRARSLAKVVLERLPGSPFGLALLADACEMAGLDAELTLTLEDLAARLGSRAEIWVRLGRARQKTLAPVDEVREALVRALGVAEGGSEPRREALLALADLDLAQGDGARAELWLERLVESRRPEVAMRRAEARLLQRDTAGARALLDGIEGEPTDGRLALLKGRVLALAGEAAAFAPLLRAYVLDEPGASELLSSTVAWVTADALTLQRVRLAVEGRDEASLARWRAAFARAEGKRDEARKALRDALAGDPTAARPLLDAALEDRDPQALEAALAVLAASTEPAPEGTPEDAVVADARRLQGVLSSAPPVLGPALDELQAISSDRVLPWAASQRRAVLAAAIPPGGAPAEWPSVLSRLDAHARSLHDLEGSARVAELSAERRRPVRVAIVGEFNAGKSTFINALIGADVAPTGVLPTTATLHHLRYAPDPIARILFEPGHDPPERIVPSSELRAALKSSTEGDVRRVEIMLPLSSLTRVEILDTPGFNAPDARHARAARGAFEEADFVIWLLDAAQPLKQSERLILDEAKAARIPVQMLVNKADRLSPADLETVMKLVATSLEEAALTSWAAPVALSARLALAGKLGDAQALERSGWARVQELLDTEIVARSEELKERALRRRASRIALDLAALAAVQAERDAAAVAAQETRALAVSRVAARVDREAEELAKKVEAALEEPSLGWQRDLDVVVTGRDRQAAAHDPTLARYRMDRALARLAPALARAMVVAADGSGLGEADLLPLARALVRPVGLGTPRAAGDVLGRAAIATLIERLAAMAVVRAAPPRSGRMHDELAALVECFA